MKIARRTAAASATSSDFVNGNAKMRNEPTYQARRSAIIEEESTAKGRISGARGMPRSSPTRRRHQRSISISVSRFSAFPGAAEGGAGVRAIEVCGRSATRFFAEEGVVVNAVGPFDLGAYVNTTDSVDQHSLDWNRFMRGSGGVKLVKPFILGGFGGLVRADLGYSVEHRFVSDRTAAAPSADINYWVGWNPHLGRFPGSSWGIAALNISPTELHN